ncbi:probable galactinol--sucrose galactosyltransferase 2 [Fagus crenata]
MHVGEPIEPPTPLAVSTSGTSEGAAEEPSLLGSSKLVEVPGPDLTPIFLEKQEWLSAHGTKVMEKEGRMPILETEIKTVPSQPKEGRVESKLNVGESIEPLTLIAVSTPGTSRQAAVEPVPVMMLPSGINEIEIAPTDGQLLLEVSTGASLLQSSECGLFIKMHDLIRDLASRILSLEAEDHHIEVCSLSDFGISNLNGLRLCVVRDCPKIEAVIASNELSEAVFPILEHLSIYYLSNLGRLWEGMIPQGSFNMLRILTVHTCLKLKFVFATSMLQFFSNLEELIVEHCPAITEIIFQDRVVDSGSGTLPRLKTIKLHYLPELVDIMQGAWPPLENISFYNCPILKKLGIDSKTSHTIKEIKAENANHDPKLPQNPCRNLLQSLALSMISHTKCREEHGQLEFAALEHLENLEFHSDSTQIVKLYNRIKQVMASLDCPKSFTLKDLIKPDSDRTELFLSAILNFSLYRGGYKFLSLFRVKIWWMIPRVGKSGSEIPWETQMLLLEAREQSALHDEISSDTNYTENTFYILLLLVLEGQFRTSLQGTPTNELQFCVESGDVNVQTSQSLEAVFINFGDNPFELLKNSIKILEKHRLLATLKNKKPTWTGLDGALRMLSTLKSVQKGSKRVFKGGCVSKFLIIDDGWQEIVNEFCKEGEPFIEGILFASRLVDIKKKIKFKSSGSDNTCIDLHDFIDSIKDKYGLKFVYVCHALAGYWGGVLPSSETMKKYNSKIAYPIQSPGNIGNLRDIVTDILEKYGVGLIEPEKVFEFYNNLHSYLASCSVDGVKVDVQNLIETLGF